MSTLCLCSGITAVLRWHHRYYLIRLFTEWLPCASYSCFTYINLIHTAVLRGSYYPYTFKFFLFIYFNWRIITLQYCNGFGIPRAYYTE